MGAVQLKEAIVGLLLQVEGTRLLAELVVDAMVLSVMPVYSATVVTL